MPKPIPQQNLTTEPAKKESRLHRGLKSSKEVFLIIGSLCGIAAFFWQVHMEDLKGRTRLGCAAYVANTDYGKSFLIHIQITNVGNSPLYVETVMLQTATPVASNTAREFQFQLMSKESNETPIAVGAARKFESQPFDRAKFEELVRKFGDIALIRINTQRGQEHDLDDLGDGLRRSLMTEAPGGLRDYAFLITPYHIVEWPSEL